MSAGLAVIIVVAVAMVTGVVAPVVMSARQDARARDRLRERLEYATASRRYWQARAARAEHELSRSPADDAWPLYRPGCGRPWIEPNGLVSTQSGDWL